MLQYDPKKQETMIAIGTTLPMTPMFAVYYDSESGKIIAKPVISLSVREHVSMGGPYYTQIRMYPIVLDKDTGTMVEESGDTEGYLGLSDEADPKGNSWNDKVRDLRKRMKGGKAE